MCPFVPIGVMQEFKVKFGARFNIIKLVVILRLMEKKYVNLFKHTRFAVRDLNKYC